MIVIFPSEISAAATGMVSGIILGFVDAKTVTCPLMKGAVSHFIMQFPTLFSSQTTDMVGGVLEQEGNKRSTASQFNRFLYIV